MMDWKNYRNVHREPVVISPTGLLTNHHYLEDGNLGERVTDDDATHFIVHVTTVEEAV